MKNKKRGVNKSNNNESKKSLLGKFIDAVVYKDFIARIFILQGAFFTAIILGFLMGQWFGFNNFIQGIFVLIFYLIETCYLLFIYERNLNIWYSLFTYLLIFVYLVKMF